MPTRTMQQVIKHVALPLISAFACYISAPAYAAKADAAKKPAAQVAPAATSSHRGMRLKLDQARLDPALADEECDDDDLELTGAAQAYPTAPAPQPKLALNNAPQAERAAGANAMPVAIQAVPEKAPVVSAPAKLAPVAQAETPKPKPKQIWEIVPTDKTLNSALARWAASAGWQLVWELPVDYAIEARTSVPGTFEEAVGMVAKSMEGAETPMKAIFYSGNKVLRIVAKGVE